MHMRPVVPEETFNPDPDARYHRSLVDAFPVRNQPLLLLRLEPPTLAERLTPLWRKLVARCAASVFGRA